MAALCCKNQTTNERTCPRFLVFYVGFRNIYERTGKKINKKITPQIRVVSSLLFFVVSRKKPEKNRSIFLFLKKHRFVAIVSSAMIGRRTNSVARCGPCEFAKVSLFQPSSFSTLFLLFTVIIRRFAFLHVVVHCSDLLDPSPAESLICIHHGRNHLSHKKITPVCHYHIKYKDTFIKRLRDNRSVNLCPKL